MVDFRRCITALAALALFTGLASAQQGESCSAQASSNPPLRGEGFTEQTGDIVITCVGGTAGALSSVIPLVNITIFYNTQVTSRLFASPNTSEALLLIDEPGTSVGTPGSLLPQVLCATPLTGCAAFVGPQSITAISPAVNGPTAVTLAAGTVPAPNVYEGVVAGNSVTFFGVPALPPGTVGTRVYRILNVRVNAQPLAGGSTSGQFPVQAQIVVSGSASLPISNAQPFVGFVTTSLTASAGSDTENQCSSVTKKSVSTITFTENFGSAFKTRIAAQTTTAFSGQSGIVPASPAVGNQSTPGLIYNSESNFIFGLGGSPNVAPFAGLADFGTRLKATFNNIPSGAHIFVSTTNVNNNAFPILAPPSGGGPIGGSAGNATPTTGAFIGFAALINGETSSDGNAVGFIPSISASDNGPNNGNVPIAEVPIVAGTGTAVWEVLNTNANTNESFKFAVFLTFSSNVQTNSPLPGTSTISLSYAPTPPAFTTGAGTVASSSLTIPRFAFVDANAAGKILTVQICRTVLLYPYITNQAGFDTGLTVANTSIDPLDLKADGTKGFQGSNATGAQKGNCKFNYFGGTTAAPTIPPATTDTGNIDAGTVYANTLQTIAPGFQGYMFAVCNFQFAHGFAFISDVGARNLAMGYLAIVIPDPGTGGRTASPPCQGLGNGSSCLASGEQDSH